MSEGLEKDGMSRRNFLRGAAAAGIGLTLEGSLKSAEAKEAAHMDPFDRPLEPLKDNDMVGGIFAKRWPSVLAGISKDRETLETCRAAGTCSEASTFLNDLVAGAKQYEGWSRINHMNGALNGRIKAQTFRQNIEQSIVNWDTPLEVIAKTLTNEGVDCKGLCVTKYAAIGELGIPPEDRMAVITEGPLRNALDPVQDVATNEKMNDWHVVVLVRLDGQWKVLEDGNSPPISDSDYFTLYREKWQPKYALTEAGVKRFADVPLKV